MTGQGNEVCIIDRDGDDVGNQANLGFSIPKYEDLYKTFLSDLDIMQQQRCQKGPLRLKLTKSGSLINLLEEGLMNSSNTSNKKMKMSSEGNENMTGNSSSEIQKTNNDFASPQKMSEKSKASANLVSPQMSENSQGTNNSYRVSHTLSAPERLKASNFPIHSLQIGNWKRYAINDAEMVAKCYYAKKKLVWEVLNGRLKQKMEILWSDIIGIRADMQRNQYGILEIELHRAPVFYRETALQPRRHTMWLSSSDFTGGQALMCRWHRATFYPGYLDKNYEKLLQCDKNLLMLSQKPFPTQHNPFFPDAYPFFGFDGYASCSPVRSTNQSSSSNAPAVMACQHISENQIMNWNQGLGNGFTSDGNTIGTLFGNTSSIVPNDRNVGYQSPLIANLGNTSPIVSTNVDSGVYQPKRMTQFRNTSPSIPINLLNIGNNIRYQPNYTSIDDGIFGVPSNVGNNMDYGSHNHGDFEVFPQLSFPSSSKNQEPLQLVQQNEVPYQHLLPPQPSQRYDNSSHIVIPDSTSLDIGHPCQGYNNPPVSVTTNPTTFDASQPCQSTSLVASEP